MAKRQRFFERAYRRGETRWDSGITPPEVEALVATLTPGRALDLGCGTGTNALYLAKRGWQVVGLDFSSLAIERAETKRAPSSLEDVTFIQGDATRITDSGVQGQFDLVLDIGCFHGIPKGHRDAYVQGVTEHTRPGGTLLMFAFPMGWRLGRATTLESQIRKRFGTSFDLERIEPGRRPAGAAWFTLRRTT